MSERLACKAVGLARSTYRLPMAATPADPDAPQGLIARLRCQIPVPWVPLCVGVLPLMTSTRLFFPAKMPSRYSVGRHRG